MVVARERERLDRAARNVGWTGGRRLDGHALADPGRYRLDGHAFANAGSRKGRAIATRTVWPERIGGTTGTIDRTAGNIDGASWNVDWIGWRRIDGTSGNNTIPVIAIIISVIIAAIIIPIRVITVIVIAA
ncbi:hypothetical protein GCM10011491_33040 [Brucella endophytica]|uniref:Uncharacterized protein n=1 Tax=Brucella endophytica TaxID=1963359 RepID=A0A916SIQ7_9HYPH|nr:hypothetical protein GCM10011491_33040 [Brucella endophytica]